MPIPNHIGFLSAHLNHKECEIFQTNPNEFTAFIPSRENYEAKITLGVASFTAADKAARDLGLEPQYT